MESAEPSRCNGYRPAFLVENRVPDSRLASRCFVSHAATFLMAAAEGALEPQWRKVPRSLAVGNGVGRELRSRPLFRILIK